MSLASGKSPYSAAIGSPTYTQAGRLDGCHDVHVFSDAFGGMDAVETLGETWIFRNCVVKCVPFDAPNKNL